MKKIFLLFAATVLFAAIAQAQSYQWITGGGSASPMTYSRDWPRITSMCTDEARNIYVTSPVGDVGIQADTFHMTAAFFTGYNTPHTLVVSYDCSGNFRWAKLIDAPNTAINNGIIYSRGNVYLAETLEGTSMKIGYDTTFSPVAPYGCISCVIKLDTMGGFKWVRITGNEIAGGNGQQGCTNIAVDGHGNIHHYDIVPAGVMLSPSVTSILGTYDLKYDTAGNLLSAIRMEIDTLGGAYWTEGPALIYPAINNASGVVYACLSVNDTATGYSSNCLAAYDTLGHQLWYDTCFWPAQFNGLAYDGNNNLYTIGFAQFNTTDYTAHFPIHGDTIIGNGYAITKLSSLLTLDTFGNLKHHFDVNFDENGGFSDLRTVPGGKIAVTGDMIYAAKYGGDSITNTTGQQEPFNAVFDTSGHLLHWDYDTGTAFYNWGITLTVDNIGNVYYGGMSQAQLAVPGLASTVSVGGSTNFFVDKYGYSNCDSILLSTPEYPANSRNQKISVYPNPASVQITLENARGNNIQIFNILGKVVYSGTIDQEQQKVNVSNLPAGTFMIQLTDASGRRINKLFIKQ